MGPLLRHLASAGDGGYPLDTETPQRVAGIFRGKAKRLVVADSNPYASPSASPAVPQSQGGQRWAHLLFFVVNFFTAVLLVFSAIVSIVAPQSPFDFFGGIVLLVPVSLYAVAEWVAWYRQNRRIRKLLGVLNLCAAAVAALAVIANVWDALAYRPSVSVAFWLWVLPIGFSVFCYLLACGLLRIRRSANGKSLANSQ